MTSPPESSTLFTPSSRSSLPSLFSSARMKAHVRLLDVEEYVKPYAVTRKSDGTEFMLDPGFNCTVEIVDDNDNGSDDSARFFGKFKYKKDSEGHWINISNSKLGVLTEVVKPGYFEDDTIPELTAEDLEGFEMICRIKPKKNPTTGQVTGSTIDWETFDRSGRRRPPWLPLLTVATLRARMSRQIASKGQSTQALRTQGLVAVDKHAREMNAGTSIKRIEISRGSRDPHLERIAILFPRLSLKLPNKPLEQSYPTFFSNLSSHSLMPASCSISASSCSSRSRP